ncbi:MAG TPA: DinB family protein [Thermoanaerobaculia bacterium]|nr:DinB family protein [Thermoanaerobaculia bacterium]
MTRPITLALVLLLAVSAFAGDVPLSANADRDALVAQLKRTEKRFLESVDGLSEAQWTFKSAPDRWSIAEAAEHITASESFIRTMVAGAMKETLAAPANQDEKILVALVDRSKKFKAPEPLIPTNRFTSPEATLGEYRKQRAETIQLASSDVDLRARGNNHFLLGPLDANGWFLFLSAHSERHTLQIEEVKADPNFPKQ